MSKPLSNSQPSAAQSAPAQTVVGAEALPDGRGGFVIIPKRIGKTGIRPDGTLVQEISTVEAARLLGVCRATIWYIRQSDLGKKHLKWRFISAARGKILFTVESVLAYKAAVQELED